MFNSNYKQLYNSLSKAYNDMQTYAGDLLKKNNQLIERIEDFKEHNKQDIINHTTTINNPPSFESAKLLKELRSEAIKGIIRTFEIQGNCFRFIGIVMTEEDLVLTYAIRYILNNTEHLIESQITRADLKTPDVEEMKNIIFGKLLDHVSEKFRDKLKGELRKNLQDFK